MKFFPTEQGSLEWVLAKVGIPSSSNFDKIITPAKMQLSSQADKYAWRLIAEQLLNAPLDDYASAMMSRGNSMEIEARGYYELTEGVDIAPGGFAVRDDRKAGASPDGFVGNDGVIEIKCPSAEIHVGYLLDDKGIGYRAQVQGQLWVCEREWCDTLSYHPTLPKALVRQHRDEEFIGKLAAAIDLFHEMMLDMKDKLQRGYGLFEGEEFPALQLVQG
jgi:hypothetical protein